MSANMQLNGTVRMVRETLGMTQQELATAAGVSLSTVRRLERESGARFHAATEHRIEFALKLKEGAFEHLRNGGSVDAVFETGLVLWLGHSSPYGDAPLSDVVAADSYVAAVMAKSLKAIGARASEELSLAAAGRLFPDHKRQHHDFMFDWLPWPARSAATAPWLHRVHDSAAQLQSILADGIVPRPLRMAEAVTLKIAYERAWIIDTNSFYHDGDEVVDPIDGRWDLVYDHCDPCPLFNPARIESEWVDTSSPLHPARWWVLAN